LQETDLQETGSQETDLKETGLKESGGPCSPFFILVGTQRSVIARLDRAIQYFRTLIWNHNYRPGPLDAPLFAAFRGA
jgi:hypothetical protein